MKKDLSKRPVRARRKKTMNSFYYNSDYSNDLNSEESKGRMSFLKRGETSDGFETSGNSKTKEQRKYHDMYNNNQRVGNNPMMNELRVNSIMSHDNKKNDFFDDSNNLKDSSDNEKRIKVKNHRAQNEEVLNIKNEVKMENNGSSNSLRADKGKSYNTGANASSKASCNRTKHLSNSSENNYAKMAEKLPHVVGVRFDKSQNRWLSGICINGRCINRYFPVYKYGFEEARRLAIQHRKNFETANLGHLKKQQGESKTSHLNLLNINSQIPNGFKDIQGKNKLIFKYLSYDSIQKEWVVTYDYDNKVLVNKFPVDIYGYNNAYEMAVQCINKLTVCNQDKMCKNVNQDVNQDASQSVSQSVSQSAGTGAGQIAKMFKGDNMKGLIGSENELIEQGGVFSSSLLQRKEKTNKLFNLANKLLATPIDSEEMNGLISHHENNIYKGGSKHFVGGEYNNKTYSEYLSEKKQKVGQPDSDVGNPRSDKNADTNEYNNFYKNETSFLSNDFHYFNSAAKQINSTNNVNENDEDNDFLAGLKGLSARTYGGSNNNNANDSSSSTHFKPDLYNESSYAAVNASSFPLPEDDGIIGNVFDNHKNILTNSSSSSNIPGKNSNAHSNLAYLSTVKKHSDDNNAKLLNLLSTSLISEEDQNAYHLLNNVLKHGNMNNKSIDSGSTTLNHTLDEEENEKRAVGVVKWNHLIKSQEYEGVNHNGGEYNSNSHNNMSNMNNVCNSSSCTSRRKKNPFQGSSTSEGITNPQILEAFLKLSSGKDGGLDSSINLDESEQPREDKNVRNGSRHYGEDIGEGSHSDENDLSNRAEENHAFGQFFHRDRETVGRGRANDDKDHFQNEVEKKQKINEHLNYENILNFNKMIRNIMKKNNNDDNNQEKIIEGINMLINNSTDSVGDKSTENVTNENRENEQSSYDASNMNELQSVIKRNLEASINYDDYITVKDEQDDDAMNVDAERGEDATPIKDFESEDHVHAAQNDIAVYHTSSNGDVVTNKPSSDEEANVVIQEEEKSNGENTPDQDTQKRERECPEKNVENITDQNAEKDSAPNDATTTTQKEDNPTETNQLEEKKTKQNIECNEIAVTLYPWKKGIQWNEQRNMWVCKLWDESGNEITKHVYVKNKEGVEIGYNYCSKMRMNSFAFYLTSELKKFPQIEEISYDLQNLCFVVDYKDEERKRYSFEGGICRAFEDAVEYLNKRKGEENDAAEHAEKAGEQLNDGADRGDDQKQTGAEDQAEANSQVDVNKQTDENSQTDGNKQTGENSQTDGNKQTDENSQTDGINQTDGTTKADANHGPHNIADFVQDERNHAQLDEAFKELNYFECMQKLPSSNTCEQTKLAYSLKPWVKGIIWEEKMKKWVVFFKDINKNLRISFFNPCDYNNDVILSYKKCCEYFLQIKKSNNFDENKEDFSESIRDFINNFEFDNTTSEHHLNEDNKEEDEDDNEVDAGGDLIQANQRKSIDYYGKDKDHINFGDYTQVNSSYLSKISDMLVSMRKENNNGSGNTGNDHFDDDEEDAVYRQHFLNGGKAAEKRKFIMMSSGNGSNNLSYEDPRKLIKLELPNDEILHSSQNGNDIKGNNAAALLHAFKYAADQADRKGNGKGDLLLMHNNEFFNHVNMNHANFFDNANEKTRKRKRANKRTIGKGKHGIGDNTHNAAAGSDNTESGDDNESNINSGNGRNNQEQNDANRNSNSGAVRKGLVESKKYLDLHENSHLLNGSNDYLLNDEDGSYKMDYSGSERQKKGNLTNEYSYNTTSAAHNNNGNAYQEDGTATATGTATGIATGTTTGTMDCTIGGRGIKNEANYDSNFLGGNSIDSNSDIMMNGNNANSNHINLLKQQQGVVAGANIAAMLDYVRNNADNATAASNTTTTTTTLNTDLAHNNNGKMVGMRNYEKYTSNMESRSINKSSEKLDCLIDNNINVRLPKSEILNQAASLPKLQGMFFDKRRNYWTVSVCGFRKSFGVRTRGVYQAYKLAAEFRNRILETNKGKCYPQKSSSMSSSYKYNVKNTNSNGLLKDEKGSFAHESAIPTMEDENLKKKTLSLCNIGNGNNDKDLLPGGDPRGVTGMVGGAFGAKGYNNLGFVTSNIYDYLWDKKSNGIGAVAASSCSVVCGAVCTGMCTAIGGSTICSGACGGICSGNCSGGKKDVTNNSSTNSVSYDENFANLEDDKANLNGKTNKCNVERRLRGNYCPSKNENGIMSMMTDSNLMHLLNEGTGAAATLTGGGEALLKENKTSQLKKANGHNVSSSNSAISNNGGNPANYSPTHIFEVENINSSQDYYVKGEDGKTDLNKSEDYKNGKSNSSSNHVSPSINLIKAGMNSDDGSKAGNVSFTGLDSDDVPNGPNNNNGNGSGSGSGNGSGNGNGNGSGNGNGNGSGNGNGNGSGIGSGAGEGNNNLHKISSTFGEQFIHEEPYGKNVTHNDYDTHAQNNKALTEVDLLNKLISHNIDENLCFSYSNNVAYPGDENYEHGKEDLYKTYNFDGETKTFNFSGLLDETVEERDIRINKEVNKCKFVEGLIYDEANKCFRIKINGYRKAYSVIRRGVKEAYKLSIEAIQQIRRQAQLGGLGGLGIGLNGSNPSSGNPIGGSLIGGNLIGGNLNNTSEQGQINSNNLTHFYNSSLENSRHSSLYNYQYKNKQETQNDFTDSLFENAPDVNNNGPTQVDSNKDDCLGETKKILRENNNPFPTLNIDDKYYELLKTAIIICLNDILMNSIPKLFHIYKNISSTTNVKIEDVLNNEKKRKEQSIKYHIEYTQNSIGVSSLIPYLRLFSMEILNNVLPSTQSLEIQRQIIHSLDLQAYNTSY